MSSYSDFRSSLRLQQMLALSPDGGQVAYADDASGQFNLTIRPVEATGQPSRITSFRHHTVRDAAWHPNRSTLVFVADRDGDEHTQIYFVPAAGGGGQPVPLTDNPDAEFGLPAGSPFTPDGKLMAYIGNDRTIAHQDVIVRELATDRIQRVDTGEGQAEAGFWSPDGKRLSLARIYHGYNRIVHVAHTDGTPSRRLTFDEVPCDYQLGPWFPDGSGFLVRTDRGREFAGLAVMDATTGALRWLETPSWDVEFAGLSTDGRVLAWIVNENGAARLCARDLLSGKDIAVPELPAGKVSQLRVSPDGAIVAMLLTTATRPWNVAVADLRTAGFSWLTDATAACADPAELVEPERVSYPGEGGHEIPALVYRPRNAGGPVGVVVSVHGGPKFQERPVYNYEGFYQYLLAKGIAVVAPNIRGSSGYGKTYQQQINRSWGTCDLADMEATVRYLKAQDWVDQGRLALIGRSYGAFVVLTCLARLPETGWAAAVEFFGPSNLVTAAEAVPPAFRATSREVLGDPDTERDSLLARSPISYAENIKAPLFVVQGARDRRVPPTESEQLVGKLRALGAEVRYDVYPDEGHGFTKSANEMKAYSDAAEFLVSYLG
jgi:dipeptidyl aminopeptidase/acylaminoacyl peptidase